MRTPFDEKPFQSCFFLILGSGIHFSASLSKTKDNDDQSALAEIIHHMADNIIDGPFKIWISDWAFKLKS